MSSKHVKHPTVSSMASAAMSPLKKKDFDSQSIISSKSQNLFASNMNMGSKSNLTNRKLINGSITNISGGRSLNMLNDTDSNYSFGSSVAGKRRGNGSMSILASERDPSYIGIIKPRFFKREESEIYCVRFTHADEHVCVGLGNGNIQVYSTKTNSIVCTLQNPSGEIEGTKLPITAICCRPERREFKHGNVIAATYIDGKLVHWHYTTGQRLSVITEENNQLFCAQYSSNGKHIATGGSEPHITIYDGLTQKFLFQMVSGSPNGSAGHSNRIFALKFHPTDPNVLISGGWDNTIQIWDLSKRVSTRSIYSPHICGDSIDIDFTGEKLLTGSYRKNDSIQIWSISKGTLIQTIPWSTIETNTTDRNCLLYSCQFSKCLPVQGNQKKANSYIVAGGGCSATNEVRVYNSENGKCVAMIQNSPQAFFAVDFSANERMLACGGGTKSLYVYDVDPNLLQTDFQY